jgi:uroporphyrinogen decarboxylase
MASERFSKALSRELQNIPPIWFMRQAGRYHSHYQSIRAQYSFEEMCKTPQLAAEVAMGPIRDFDFDAAILFSDILFPLEAMGQGLKYDPAPTLDWHLDEDRVSQLRTVGEALPALEFQKQAMIETRKQLPDNKSLVGFVGGPWTLFTYSVEGSHKGGLERAKKLSRLFHPFCEVLLPLLEENIRIQLEGGAEVVMVFDTAAGELSPGFYRDLVVPSIERLARRFPRKVGYYAKSIQGAHLRHPFFADKDALAGLGFDHRWEIEEALLKYDIGFVQGCFDQSILFMNPDDFQVEAIKYLEKARRLSIEQRRGWVSGLGHGILPGTPEVNVRSFVQLIRQVMSH